MTQADPILNPSESMVLCPHCSAKVKEGAQFCAQCGHPMIAAPAKTFCQTCGAKLQSDEKFCSNCGTPAPEMQSAEALSNIAAYNDALSKASKKKKKGHKIRNILLGCIGAILLLAAAGYFIVLPAYTYQQACLILADNRFDAARDIFIQLGDYKDSALMSQECLYREAEYFQKQGVYKYAYLQFIELGDYKDSDDKVTDTIERWITDALTSNDLSSANSFAETVTLKSSQYELLYSSIMAYIDLYGDSDHWYGDGSSFYNRGGTQASEKVQKLLSVLPTSYKDTATLQRLFDVMVEGQGGFYIFFEDNESLMRKCWSLEFVRDMAEHNSAINYFLVDSWTTLDGDYYISFDDTFDSSSNLPWVAKPKGTKYYDIDEMIYYWDDNNNKHLAKVFRFEIVDYDTIKVYCYKNSRTYTLYR